MNIPGHRYSKTERDKQCRVHLYLCALDGAAVYVGCEPSYPVLHDSYNRLVFGSIHPVVGELNIETYAEIRERFYSPVWRTNPLRFAGAFLFHDKDVPPGFVRWWLGPVTLAELASRIEESR